MPALASPAIDGFRLSGSLPSVCLGRCRPRRALSTRMAEAQGQGAEEEEAGRVNEGTCLKGWESVASGKGEQIAF